MPMKKRDHAPRPRNPRSPLGAMAYARAVRAEYKELEKLEAGYHKSRHKFVQSALISYRKFLVNPTDYRKLLSEENIKDLLQKPDLKKTSRLPLYYFTGAQNEAQRNTAGKYARIVDYLQEQGVENSAAADYVEKAGGIEALLKEVRGNGAPKAAVGSRQEDDETRQEELGDFDQEDESDEAPGDAPTSSNGTHDLFDEKLDLSIRTDAETREQVFSSAIGMNEPFYLECRKTGPVGRTDVRIVGKLVDWPLE
jgi:hypothetical protein